MNQPVLKLYVIGIPLLVDLPLINGRLNGTVGFVEVQTPPELTPCLPAGKFWKQSWDVFPGEVSQFKR